MTKKSSPGRRLAVCRRNDDYELDLVLDRIYPVLPDPSAERSGWIRVVDETGEDYLYPASFFQAIETSGTPELRRAS